MYERTAALSLSLLSKQKIVGEDVGKNEEDGKFDGCDVFDGGVDGAKLIDGASDVSGTTITIPVLGDKSSGTENPDNLENNTENNTENTTTAATNMMQTNARNRLVFSCLCHAGGSSGGSSGTPSYTGSFGTSVASSSSMDR
mmetsp:Transcript_20450/g.38610  ORF Transcript_20450/g.38610 Transcript_20450/m.38610 type:complete len:142 (-) Transcript_20450:446-871(-)